MQRPWPYVLPGYLTAQLGPEAPLRASEKFQLGDLSCVIDSCMDDDFELPASNKSPFKAMEKVVGVSRKLDHAMMLYAAGANQKVAAAAAKISPTTLCNFLRTERGQSRMTFWLSQELRSLAPKAIRALDRNLGARNAMASNRAAETILDRSGLNGVGMKLGGDLIVHLNLSMPKDERVEKVVDHE